MTRARAATGLSADPRTSRPTSWDDAPAAPLDARFVFEPSVLTDAQLRDFEGLVERAHVRHRTDAASTRHLDHLAALGRVTARVVPGHQGRMCALTDAGRAR